METTFKETKIGCIPEEWDIKKFSDLAQYINGRAFKPQDWGRTGLPIIRILQLNDPTADCDYYDGEVDERNIIVNGDLVFSWSATLAVIIWNRGKAALNQHLFKVVPSDGIDKRFLRYRIDASIEYLARMSHGSTMKHIKKGVLDEVSVAIPPLPEQRKIAGILSTVDEAIEKTDAIIRETQQLKKGLMQRLFTEGIGHTRFKEQERLRLRGSRVQISSIGELPESWQVKKIAEIARDKKGAIKIGPFGSQLKKEDMVDSGILVFGQENVFTKDFKMGTYFISPEKFETLKSVEIFPGDIVLTMMGTIGDCCVVPEEIDRGIMDSHLMRIQVREHVNPYFIARLIRDSYTVKKQVECLSQGAIMSGLNLTLVKDIFLLIPLIEEQNRIEEILSEVDTKIETEQAFKSELEQLKKGLMQVLLTGKVRVKV